MIRIIDDEKLDFPSIFYSFASKYIIYTDSLSCLHALQYEALDLPRLKVGVPNIDFNYHINQYILSTWQDDWHGVVANKLHSTKQVPGAWQSSYKQCRKDEVVLCRARIGHTHLTHSYILRKYPPPQCDHFAEKRKYIFCKRNVFELFRFTRHSFCRI